MINLYTKDKDIIKEIKHVKNVEIIKNLDELKKSFEKTPECNLLIIEWIDDITKYIELELLKSWILLTEPFIQKIMIYYSSDKINLEKCNVYINTLKSARYTTHLTSKTNLIKGLKQI